MFWRKRVLTENAFDTGRDLRESPRFHDVAKSVGAKTGLGPEMEKG